MDRLLQHRTSELQDIFVIINNQNKAFGNLDCGINQLDAVACFHMVCTVLAAQWKIQRENCATAFVFGGKERVENAWKNRLRDAAAIDFYFSFATDGIPGILTSLLLR